MAIVAMLFSKIRNAKLEFQVNVSGRCCQNVGVDQLNTNVFIEQTNWYQLNRHAGVDRMAFTPFQLQNHLQV